MKLFLKTVFSLLIFSVFFYACNDKNIDTSKNENIITTSNNTFPKFNEDTVKKYVYQALNNSKNNVSCDSNINEEINNYLLSKKIDASNCDHKDVLEYYRFLVENKNAEAFKFLLEKKYISNEAYDVISSIQKELMNSKESDFKIYDEYIKEVSNNKSLSVDEKNKIILGLQISKYSLEYFSKNSTKGACGRCIRRNKAFIFGAGTGGGALIGTLGCITLGNPVAVVACITATTGVVTVWFICNSCRNVCWYCLK